MSLPSSVTDEHAELSRRFLLAAGGSLTAGGVVAATLLSASPASAASTNGLVVVAGHDAPANVKAAADFICDNVADDVQINAALASVGADTIGHGTNGGVVLLVGRVFTISGPILMRTQTTLRGAFGKSGTKINAAAPIPTGPTAAMIRLATPDTQYVEVSDLALNGKGLALCGVYFAVSAGQEWDAFNVLKNLYIYRTGEAGIWLATGTRNRANQVVEVRIIDAGKIGVHVACTDNFFDRVDVGSAGSDGFYVPGANNRFVNCKAWFSDGHGFHIPWAGRDNQFSACESQDNQEHGWLVMGARNILSACCADSNGYGSLAGGGDGFHLRGRGTNLHGSAFDKNEGGRGLNQRYGVNIAESVPVIVNVTTFQNKTAPKAGTAAAGSVVNVLNHT